MKHEIPELKGIKELPITFELLHKVPLGSTPPKDLFFNVNLYQGLALAEKYYKPCSKIIDWRLMNE